MVTGVYNVRTISIIYGLAHNGDLMWFHHNGNDDGSFRLARNEGKKVGHGWNVKQVFSGGEGIIYAINENKDLMWARHEGRSDGSFTWATSDMQKVGHNWSFKQVFLVRWHHLRHKRQQ